MPRKKHHNDDAAGPGSEEAESGHEPDGQPAPEDQAESEGEKQARDVERGFDHALNRIPG